MERAENISVASWLPRKTRARTGFSARAFAGLIVAAALVSAALASWLPLQVSIVTVFLFAGPHNWFEARYFLMRLPARFGREVRYVGMTGEAPFFIVGVPRSGTTLLRQMLRGHPRLAIPRESHFVPAALAAPTGAAALDLIVNDEHFAQWAIDADQVRRRAAATDMSPPAVVRASWPRNSAA